MRKSVTQPIITKQERDKTERYLRRIKAEGYRPWVTVRQSHSIGQGQIIHSHKTGRTHHFLSRGELEPFFHFEHEAGVEDIFEQYPLPLADTMRIAAELNIVHPSSYKERIKFDGHRPAKTMTLDYLIKHRDNSLHAYNFKYAESLDASQSSPQAVKRTDDKAKIEREYCKQQGISWTQLTEQTFNSNKTLNLKFLRECFSFKEQIAISTELKSVMLVHFNLSFDELSTSTVREVLEHVSDQVNLPLHQVQCIFQNLAYEGAFKFNFNEVINLNRPLPVLKPQQKEVFYAY
ncbi:TnsA endonuclease N-terminal domain-containing protein [Thalassotalea sp. LPB0316]|uniref:TnsA endonuclease N-terminal domain-containing protein n=1 Tax=Thalassotalea sp. LPB0316 TaxID=2769490 RepID=UPI0018668063|nr:TnsA endonuclease N-terminal domain-containing protein [Thalassotalea sp. LPB0316]QOL25670.1 TnsA endonuclease N-terminal domain-containing protein [Thalassotalea sp. LPB0316]